MNAEQARIPVEISSRLLSEQVRYDGGHKKHSHTKHILCGYLLKKDSPSCGMEDVKIWNARVPSRNGVGIYAARLMKNLSCLPVEEEGAG